MVETAKLEVTTREFSFHEAKPGRPPAIKVTYTCGDEVIKLWLCPEHAGYAKAVADKFWTAHGGGKPAPASVATWLERQGELAPTVSIEVRDDGKYWSVVSYQV